MPRRAGRKQSGERGKKVDERKGQGDGVEAIENPVAPGQRWKDGELDEHPEETVDGENKADARGGEAKAGGESQRESKGIRWLRGVDGVVHKDWQELVVGDAVHGEQGISHQVYGRLAGEDFAVARWLVRGASGGWQPEISGMSGEFAGYFRAGEAGMEERLGFVVFR